MKKPKRLYWLEYTDIGPLVGPRPFEAVGFEVRDGVWGKGDPNCLLDYVIPEAESWQPEVIVFFLAPGYYWKPSAVKEPQEWLAACQRIRENPDLKYTKIVAFLGLHESTAEQRSAWRKRYDFYAQGPIKAIEHAMAIKHLVGGDVKGFEGVHYYLLVSHKHWQIQAYLLHEGADKDALQPDAEGQFSGSFPVKTRLLTSSKEGGYIWGDRVQTEMPTYIVHVIKPLEVWQREGLSTAEMERLSALANGASPGHQLLIGANDLLLKASSEAVAQVLEQAHRAGEWQIFINEHLWFEGLCPSPIFESIVYQGVVVDPWQWPITM